MQFTKKDIQLIDDMVKHHVSVSHNPAIANGSNIISYTLTPSKKQRMVLPIASGGSSNFSGVEIELETEVEEKLCIQNIKSFTSILSSHMDCYGADNVYVELDENDNVYIVSKEGDEVLSTIMIRATDEMMTVPPSVANKNSDAYHRYMGYKYDGFEEKLKTLDKFETNINTEILSTAISTYSSLGLKDVQIKFIFKNGKVWVECGSDMNTSKHMMDDNVDFEGEFVAILSPKKLKSLKSGLLYKTRIFHKDGRIIIIAVSSVGQPIFYLTPERET